MREPVGADSPSIRAAAYRAMTRENKCSHPRRMDCDELQACLDSYCRYCRDHTGEVRDGFVC